MTGIIIGLVVLMVLAYKGMSILWIAPICAGIVAFTGGLDLLPTYQDTYMTGFVNFTKAWFPVFMLGAIFGKLMEVTGAAQSVAHWITMIIGKKRAVLAVVVGCGVLAYGGVSIFVVVFAIYPLAVAVFREANVSRKLIPASLALGSFTFAMTALPGTPQIQNLIPMQYFNTTPAAAPIMGIAASFVMGVGGYLYLKWRENKLTAQGELFTEPAGQKLEEIDASKLPNPLISFIPLVAVIITLNVLKFNIIVSLVIGILLSILLNINSVKNRVVEVINQGASNSVIAIINTSAAVGFGAVVRAVPGFNQLTEIVLGIRGNPLISEAVAVNLLAGVTGSASGGLGIALAALGEKYVELAAITGIPLEAFHRIASISSGGLDSLPHNGAILTVLAICGLTHKEAYGDMFVVATAIPIVSTVVAIIFASIGLV